MLFNLIKKYKQIRHRFSLLSFHFFHIIIIKINKRMIINMVIQVLFKNRIKILHFYSLLIECVCICMRFHIFVILLENKETREACLSFLSLSYYIIHVLKEEEIKRQRAVSLSFFLSVYASLNTCTCVYVLSDDMKY